MVHSKTKSKIKSILKEPVENKKESTFIFGIPYEKKGFYILVSLIVILSFCVYHDFIFAKNLFIYKGIGSDTYNQFVPSMVHFTNYLRTEGIPKWSFNQGMGQNVFPGGINDPFTLFLYLFDGNHIAYMIVVAQLLKILTGGIIFYFYLHTMHISHFASVVGALSFSFSGYMILGGGWYGHASLVVYGAFLLFAVEQLYKNNSWIYFPIAVAIISSQVFALYLFSIFIFLYILLRYYMDHEFSNTAILGLLLKMAGLGFLGICINAVFVISPLTQMINSPRVSGEAGYFNTLKSAPAFGFASAKEYMSIIMRCFSSDIMGIGNDFRGWSNYLEAPVFYAGLINLLLIPQLFQYLKKKQKILLGGFLGIWIIFLIFPYLRHSLYLFSGDYYKTGLSFFIPVTMLFAGISALSYIDKLHKINIKTLVITLVFLLILLYYPYLPSNDQYVVDKLRTLVVVFLFLYAFLIYLYKYNRFKGITRISLLILLVAELGYFSYLTVNIRIIESSKDYNRKTGFNDYTVDAVNYLKSIDKSFYRITKNYSSGNAKFISFNDAMIQDYYGTPSYQSFNQLYYIKFLSAANILDPNNELQTRWAVGIPNRHKLQTFANVKYELTKTSDTTLVINAYDSLATFGDVSVYRNRLYLPFGYTYDRFMYEKDFKNTTKKGRAILHSFIISEDQNEKFKDFLYDNEIDTVPTILPLNEYQQYVEELRKDTLAIKEHSQNLFKGKINLEKKKLLFFSIPYDKGWHATVDGKVVQLELVNIGFMGLILDKGQHDVMLQFQPQYIRPSLFVSGISLLVYGGVVFMQLKRNKNKSNA